MSELPLFKTRITSPDGTQRRAGVWTTWSFHTPVLQAVHKIGKRTGDRIDSVSGTACRHCAEEGGVHFFSKRAESTVWEPDSQPEQVVMLGQTMTDDCCCIPVTVGGVQCTALVETSSSATNQVVETRSSDEHSCSSHHYKTSDCHRRLRTCGGGNNSDSWVGEERSLLLTFPAAAKR